MTVKILESFLPPKLLEPVSRNVLLQPLEPVLAPKLLEPAPVPSEPVLLEPTPVPKLLLEPVSKDVLFQPPKEGDVFFKPPLFVSEEEEYVPPELPPSPAPPVFLPTVEPKIPEVKLPPVFVKPEELLWYKKPIVVAGGFGLAAILLYFAMRR